MSAKSENLSISQYIMENDDIEWLSPAELDYSREKLAGMVRGQNVADIGAGNGKLSEDLAERNPDYNIFSTDFNQDAVRNARQRLESYPNSQVVRGAGAEFLENDSFDTIYIINTLQAVDKPSSLFESAYESLNEGGKMIITVPGERSLGLWPEKAIIEDEEKNLPGIETPAQVNSQEIVYGQYVIPDEWMTGIADQYGMEIREDESGAVPINPEGIPHMVDIIESGYEPQVPGKLLKGLRNDPEGIVEKLLQNDEMPEVNLWVLEK